MQHRDVDATHASLSAPQIWASTKSVLAEGFCLCDSLPTHDTMDRPCPVHQSTAYLVWEYARFGPPWVRYMGLTAYHQQLRGFTIILYSDAHGALHRIDGLPSRIELDQTGKVTATANYVRGERLPDDVHLMDRLYWDNA